MMSMNRSRWRSDSSVSSPTIRWPSTFCAAASAPLRITLSRAAFGVSSLHSITPCRNRAQDGSTSRLANREVLPSWARFLQGVIECNELTPNAARDNVMRNGALAAAQKVLGQRIVGDLTDLSLRQRDRFIDFMSWHSYH